MSVPSFPSRSTLFPTTTAGTPSQKIRTFLVLPIVLTRCRVICQAKGGTLEECGKVSVSAWGLWFNYFGIHTFGICIFLTFGCTPRNYKLWKGLILRVLQKWTARLDSGAPTELPGTTHRDSICLCSPRSKIFDRGLQRCDRISNINPYSNLILS
jgi:hypothetical protein